MHLSQVDHRRAARRSSDHESALAPRVGSDPGSKTNAPVSLNPSPAQPISAAVVVSRWQSRPISGPLLFVVGDDMKILLLLLKAAEDRLRAPGQTRREEWV